MSSLSDFSTGENLKNTFVSAVDKADYTLINRKSTKDGSPIRVSFDLPFKRINQATLKTYLLTAEGFGIQGTPFVNEYRLSSIIVNGKRFEVSDTKTSVNLVDKANDTDLNKVLKPFNNTLAVNFTAPIGAGFVLPNAEITSILTVYGERDPFALGLPNATELTKSLGSLGSKIAGIGTLALVAVIIIGILLIFVLGKTPKIPKVGN